MIVSNYPKFSWGSFSYSETRLSRDDCMDSLGYCLPEIANMGCDIHLFSETRLGNSWECDQKPSFKLELDSYTDPPHEYPTMDNMEGSTRDYWLFGLLQNGVRTDWPWSFPYAPESFTDASHEVHALCQHMGEDGHSHKTLTRAELKAKMEEIKVLQTQCLVSPESLEQNHREVLNHHARRLTEILGSLSADVSDDHQRIIFWFDN